MASKPDIQTLFKTILRSRNVYFRPPQSVRMSYPAIRYDIKDLSGLRADDTLYMRFNSYEVTLIDPDIESKFVDKLLSLPHCKFVRWYPKDGLNHFVFTLFY
jgi:hypothetical protein